MGEPLSRRLAVALLALVAVSGCLNYKSPPNLNYYEAPTPMLVGGLTWNGAQSGISWEANPDSDDPGGGTDAAAGAKAAVGWYQRQYTGSDGGTIPRIVFRSQPIVGTYFLNVTRPIEMDVYLTNAECKQSTNVISYDVEVYVGDRFAAGQTRGMVEADYYNTKATFVDGHCVKRARMHAEIDRLVPGDVVRVEFVLVGQLTSFQFGTKGDHRSVIRFPYYTPDEANERVAGVAPPPEIPDVPPDASQAPARSADPTLLPRLGGAALLLALPLRSRRRPAVALAALLLAGAFAGCLGGQKSSVNSSPSISVDYSDPDNASIPLKEGRGAVAGLVYDVVDERLRVAAVHISLLGTANTTKSDAKGGFVIKDLAPRKYTIRFDKEAYVSQEIRIEIRADTVTKLKVPLHLIVDRGAGFRPHPHDDWVGVEMPFLEQDVAIDQYLAATTHQKGGLCMNYYTITDDWCYQPFYSKDDKIVKPGTRELEIRVDWDPNANKVERVGLVVDDNSAWNYNTTVLYPRARNVPFLMQVGWEMTDLGHQLFSTWSFELIIPTQGGSTTTPMVTLNQLVTQPFHVSMKIRKGMIPFEPAHRDFWLGNDTFVVGKNLPGNPTNSIGGQRPGHTYDHNARWDYIEKLVPPDTKWLAVTMDQGKLPSRPNPQAELWYKPANIPPGMATDPTYTWGKIAPVSVEGTKMEYRIPVGEKESDAFYQWTSNWRFWFCQDIGESSHVVDNTAETLTIVAHRDEMR